MWTQILISVLAITAIIVIGFFVILSAQRDNGGRAFAILNFFIAGWLLFQLLAQFGPTDMSLKFAQSANLTANFIAYAFFLFITEFIHGSLESKSRKKLYILLLIPLLIFSCLSYSGLLITEVKVTQDGIAIASQGILYTFNIIFIVLYMIAGFIELISFAIRNKSEKRKQALILISFLSFAAFVSIIVNTVFATVAASQIAIPFSLLIMSAGILYGIIWNKLFDIRVFVAKALAYALSVALLLVFFIAGTFAIAIVLSSEKIPIKTLVFLAFVSIIGAIAFQPIKRFFDKITNRFF